MLPGKDPECFRNTSGVLPILLSLAILGPAEIAVRGAVVRLPPKTLAVLLRLAMASGSAVPVDQLFRDVWLPSDMLVRRDERTSVQKRITELRHTIDGTDAENVASVIRTERDARPSAYRLAGDGTWIDAEDFRQLVEQARGADSVTAAKLLARALDLWRGRPLVNIEHLPFARAAIHQLMALREAAARDLLDAYRAMGRVLDALAIGDQLATTRPDDTELRDLLRSLRLELRQSWRGVVRRTLDGEPAITVLVVSGDIFDERDAHLVIGFADTFDLDTTDDVVISGTSLQAQATRLLFGNDRALLERNLRAALRHGTRVARERRSTKKHGKLIRYEIGTVAVLNHANRRVFALAYSRMGNDLVARSSIGDIHSCLERLWDAVYRHGQLQPVAIPLIGTGLARVDDAGPADLLKLIAESFVTRSRARRISRELRIVVRPEDLAAIDVASVAEFIDHL
jgi:hypothetical protein